jgi:hypothetical protein
VCSDEALIEFAQRGGGSLSEAEDRIGAALEVDGGRRHIGDRDQPRQSGRGRVKDPVEAPSHDCDRIPGDVVMRARRRQGDVDRERGGPGRNLDQRFVVLPAGEAGDTPSGDEGLQRLLARHARPAPGTKRPDGTAVCLRPHFLCRDDENGDGSARADPASARTPSTATPAIASRIMPRPYRPSRRSAEARSIEELA